MRYFDLKLGSLLKRCFNDEKDFSENNIFMKNILEGLVPNAGIIKHKAKIEGKAERLARISLATGTYLV